MERASMQVVLAGLRGTRRCSHPAIGLLNILLVACSETNSMSDGTIGSDGGAEQDGSASSDAGDSGEAPSCEPLPFRPLGCAGEWFNVDFRGGTVCEGPIRDPDCLRSTVEAICPSVLETDVYQSIDFAIDEVIVVKSDYLLCPGSLDILAVEQCDTCLQIDFVGRPSSSFNTCPQDCLSTATFVELVAVESAEERVCFNEQQPCP